jgi:hypothetical protein
MLTEKEMLSNWEEFKAITMKLPERGEQLIEMYSKLGEEDVIIAPASSQIDFHNAFPGGYVDHVLRVTKFALKFYKLYEELGLKVDNFSKEELIFSALHHDLGKLGYNGGNVHYVKNTSKWHIENQGKVYTKNEEIPFMTIQDRSLYLLNFYGIKVSLNEYISIKTHDGLYDDTNKPYLMSFNVSDKMRINLSTILHFADISAYRFELERMLVKTDKAKSFYKNLSI